MTESSPFLKVIQQLPTSSSSSSCHFYLQSELSTQCDLELPPSNESKLSFPQGHPVASYVFFLVFLSLLSPPFYFSFNNPYRSQFLRKMWPIQLAFRLIISCRIFLCSLTLSNTSSFPTLLACPAWETLLVAMLPPAKSSRLLELISPSSTTRCRYHRRGIITYVLKKN